MENYNVMEGNMDNYKHFHHNFTLNKVLYQKIFASEVLDCSNLYSLLILEPAQCT